MIKVQLDENDHVDANRLHFRWTRRDWLLYGLGYLIIAAAGILMLLADDPVGLATFLILFPLILFAIKALTSFVLLPNRARKIFRQNKALQAPFEVTWDEDQLTVTAPTYNQRQPWSDFLKWREDDKLFLIYISQMQFRLIPKRAFPDAATLADFTRLLHTKVPAHKANLF